MTFRRGRFLFLGIVSILVLGALVSHRILGFNSAAVAQDKSDLIISYDIVEGDETVASCLATRISDHKWITAKHCIPGDARENYFVRALNESIPIGLVELAPGNHDVAVFSINDVNPGPVIELSDSEIEVGDLLELKRASGGPSVSSSTLKVEYKMPTLTNGVTFRIGDVVRTKTVGQGATCSGDSGGPLLDQNGRLVAIHSAGAQADCESDEIGLAAYHSQINEVRSWIDSLL